MPPTPSPCSHGPTGHHVPHLSPHFPHPTLWLEHLLGVLPKFLPSAQDPGHRQCSLLGNSLWLTTATSGDGRDGSRFPSPLEFGVSSFHFLFLYHIYVVPWIPVGSQHLLAFWSSGIQHSRSCATLPCLPSYTVFPPSIENHFNLTIRSVSSRIMTILEIMNSLAWKKNGLSVLDLGSLQSTPIF